MLSIIAAIASNNVIGKNNKLLWHIPMDLKRFKSITTGKTIIMGRKTFESLPGVLPERYHVVITRNKNFIVDDKNVEIVTSLEDILTKYENSQEEVFIIGGGEIYKELLPKVNKLYLTKLNKAYEGDTYFPQIDYLQWRELEKIDVLKDATNPISFSFITLERI
jgi:dihydrofolate reductase